MSDRKTPVERQVKAIAPVDCHGVPGSVGAVATSGLPPASQLCHTPHDSDQPFQSQTARRLTIIEPSVTFKGALKG